MKKLVILIALVALYSCSFAQDTTNKPIDPNIPPYRILTTDSVYTLPGKLKKRHQGNDYLFFAGLPPLPTLNV